MTRTLRLLARMATAILGGYCAQGLTAIAETACSDNPVSNLVLSHMSGQEDTLLLHDLDVWDASPLQ